MGILWQWTAAMASSQTLTTPVPLVSSHNELRDCQVSLGRSRDSHSHHWLRNHATDKETSTQKHTWYLSGWIGRGCKNRTPETLDISGAFHSQQKKTTPSGQALADRCGVEPQLHIFFTVSLSTRFFCIFQSWWIKMALMRITPTYRVLGLVKQSYTTRAGHKAGKEPLRQCPCSLAHFPWLLTQVIIHDLDFDELSLSCCFYVVPSVWDTSHPHVHKAFSSPH